MKLLATFFIVLFIISIPLALLFISSGTQISLSSPVTAIGWETPLKVRVTNPAGTVELNAYVEQNKLRYPVFKETKPGSRFFFWTKHFAARDLIVPVGKKEAPALQDGKARLIIEATSNDMRRHTDTISQDVEVITSPPRVVADGDQHYLNTGGSELVVFTPSGYWTEADVTLDRYKFRSFPLPSAPGKMRFAFFAYPWDLPPGVIPKVEVSNAAGGKAEASFWFKLFPKKFRSRDITIDDKFLDRVVNQIEPNGSGDLLQRFLKINSELRKKNNQTLTDLRLKSEPKLLWSQPFLQLGNSQVEAVFADNRTYIYKGKKVDRQVHLGFDLAVTAHTPIPASNDGKVLWASDLGIYGNCIVLDHGYGLQSIYGHLSEFQVRLGHSVKRGQIIAKSGATGLAGGDHLHFGMQLDGVQVNPLEWWDGHWIHDRILAKLNPGATPAPKDTVDTKLALHSKKSATKKRRR